jgi:hypothetical protein
MRRRKTFRRGRAIPILLAAGLGYVIGSYNAAALRTEDPSATPTAAQTVALRFPQALGETPVVQEAAYEHPVAAAAMVVGNARLALFEPEPTMPTPAMPIGVTPSGVTPSPAPAAAPQSAAQPAPMQVAALTPSSSLPDAAQAVQPAPVLPPVRVTAVRPHPAAAPYIARRPGYMFDDAQLATIKRRLHLTPDQERMWPAVEEALRNLPAESEREARWAGETGAVDPDSPQVQDLKSAAIPLLMSFSDEQKGEVRNLAHSMGLDQLASEF